jgi:thiamine-phosphate pyrophosphorylase
MRHELCHAIDTLCTADLITARNTLEDVGTEIVIKNSATRKNLADSLTAACKRLPEALRAISEAAAAFDSELAGKIEKIRYSAYTLEKDIVTFASPAAKFSKVSLYVIISSSLPADVLTLTQKCAAGGADCIQLRAKGIDDDRLYAVAREFVDICAHNNVLSIINDRADIAIASGADGVHLGQNDLPVVTARKLSLSPMIIGRSTHTLEQLKTACDEPITYAALGPVYSTGTKPGVEAVGLDYVADAVKYVEGKGIATVAIGGLDTRNIGEVFDLGVSAAAVCSAATGGCDPAEACRALKTEILAHKKS